MNDRREADGELVRRAVRGDGAAFESLVRRHYRAGYATALAILGDAQDAEDVCQEAWIKALEKLEDCRQPDRFRFWWLQIVRNRARNAHAYKRVRSSDELSEQIADKTGPRSTPLVLRRRLEVALRELDEQQREVVLLHDLEGWDHRSIGEALGVSEGMSRQLLFRARRTLRRRLQAMEGAQG